MMGHLLDFRERFVIGCNQEPIFMKSESGNFHFLPEFILSRQGTSPPEITLEWLAQLNRNARLHQATWLLSPTYIRLNYCPFPYLLFIIPPVFCLFSYIDRQISMALVGLGFGIGWALYLFHVEKLKATTGRALFEGVYALRTTEDKQAVSPMSGALRTSHSLIAQEIETALTRLLPQLKANDQALLDANTKQNLYQALMGSQKKQEFLLAIIRCLQTLGDVEAVPALKRITAKNLGAASVNVPIYLAAETCLKILEGQWAEYQQSQTLVRASGVSSLPGATLLRAASGTQTTSADELLHPSQAEARENAAK